MTPTFFQALVQGIKSAVFVYQHDCFVYVNAAASELTGYTQDELLGMPFWQLLHQDDQAEAKRRGRARLHGESLSEAMEVRLVTKDALILWVSHQSVLTEFEGQPAVAGITTSIEPMKRQEHIYQAMFESNHAANMQLQDGHFIDCNAETLRMFGYEDKQEFCQLHPVQISPAYQVDGTDSAIAAHQHMSIAKKQGFHRFEWLHKRSDGSVFDAEVFLTPIQSAGECILQAIILDVSEAKLASQQLQQRLKIEKALAQASRWLLSSQQTDLNQVLQVLGEAVGVDRAYLFQLRDQDRSRIDNTHEWCAAGVAAQMDQSQGLCVDFFPCWMSQLQQDKNIVIACVDRIPDKASAEKNILRIRNVKALVAVPLMNAAGELDGFIGFDDVCQGRDWQLSEQRVLRVAAEMIYATLERDRMQVALQRQADQWQQTFDAVGDGIMLLDGQGKVLRFNHAMQQLRPEMITDPACHSTCYEAIHGLQQPREDCPHEQARMYGKEANKDIYEEKYKQWLSISAYPLSNHPNGNNECVIIVRDRTATRKVSEQLERNRTELLMAQAIAHIGSWEFYIDASIPSSISEETMRIFALPSTTISTYKTFLHYVYRKDRSKVKYAIRQALDEGSFHALQYRIVRADDEIRYVQVNGECFRDKQTGQPIRLFGTVQDITEQVEMQLMHQQMELAQAENKAKSDFLAVMSHELRTPLHGIIGLQDLLAEELKELAPRHKEHLDMAQHSARMLSMLIDDILDLSKIEAGSMSLHPSTFDLIPMLYDVVSIFLVQAQQKGLTLKLHLSKVPVKVHADAMRIKQILLNIIGNAVKFTVHGSVSLHASMLGEKLCFEVRDSGIGIADRCLGRLFEPFIQCECDCDDRPQGSGLGTTIAKRFARMMGGDIAVQSELGKGTRFFIELEVEVIDDERISKDEIINQAVVQAPEDKCPDLSGLKLLLAEDDPIARFLAIDRLQSTGLEFDVAENGLIAWEKLQHGVYDVLLTDIRMPGIDGIELTRKIRAQEEGKAQHLRIIGLSADAMQHVAEEALVAGMDEFIAKPIELALLMQRLAELFPQYCKPDTE